MKSAIAHNIEVLSYHDLDGRPAFKLAMQEVAGHWYLYMGHLWHRGWSILDVTDPSCPEHVAFIPGPENTWTIQVQVAEGKMITALERIAPGWGGNEGQPYSEGFLIWDVSHPKRPRQMGHYRTHSTGTHRNFYDGGSLVHVAGGAPGFDKKIYQIVDISSPERPKEVARFWLPEQKEMPKDETRLSCHGPATVEGKRAYLPYGEGGAIILDISEPSHPRLVSQMIFKGISNHHGIHTFLPLPRRKLALVNDEAINENGEENLNLAGIIDLKDEANPRLIALFPQPSPPSQTGIKNFFEKGGRFGPHNQHHPNHQPCLEDRDDIAYLTYFNAGLRVYDTRDERSPKEIAYFIPPDPQQRIGTKPSSLVVQTEDALVDRRGFIYISHKNQGLYILRLKNVWPYGTT
ncbi:MAG: LVIVD repeat-containing protein [Candidatus Binatia bacterium]